MLRGLQLGELVKQSAIDEIEAVVATSCRAADELLHPKVARAEFALSQRADLMQLIAAAKTATDPSAELERLLEPYLRPA